MKYIELEWELRLFKLLAIVIIGFGFLVLRLSLGIGGIEALFLRDEIPTMIAALSSSLAILSVELIFWYIFRVKGKSLDAFISKKDK